MALKKKQTIAYIPYDAEDMHLRAENLHALSIVGVTDPSRDLLFASDIANTTSKSRKFPCSKFALVDHNRLGPLYEGEGHEVVAVIDHHEDEGLYKDTAKPRIIAPAGSCSSHIAALLFPDSAEESQVISELSTLLLSAMVVDTGGLAPGGKAIDVDYAAAKRLLPRSTLASQTGTNLHESHDIRTLTNTLLEKKSDVSHLSVRDLLRRDYKEYSYNSPWLGSDSSLKAGLSTVPVRLEAWGKDGKLEKDGQAWMRERGLDALGVLTTYRTEKKDKHRRQMAWLVAGEDEARVKKIAGRLWKGLEGDEELDAEASSFDGIGLELAGSKMVGRVYKQKNHKATRKVVAPLLKKVMEGSE